jgi:hypothetical protein
MNAPLASQPEHKPKGDPCVICGNVAAAHRARARPEHNFVGSQKNCEKCGLELSAHRSRPKRSGKRNPYPKRYTKRKTYLGIDGEGQGELPHRYVTIAASNEDQSQTYHVHNPKGLSTKEVLDFILDLPDDCRIFCYAFNYDLTKLLKDLPNETLYYLFRPELRKRHTKSQAHSPRPVLWEGYSINLQGTKFSVKRGERNVVIWDIWKFYQSKFVKALKLWKVGTPDEWDLLQSMKDKRNEFDKEEQSKVLEYCLLECARMAGLARKLVDAHSAAGLKLRSFYGAGSSASAMLDVMGLRKRIVPAPEEMKHAIAAAFFGGRFENAYVGTVKGPIHSYDISSAYPYQLCFLPCLEHQRWERTTRRTDLEGKRTALIRYRLRKLETNLHWAPFPFRDRDGSICFPQESGGGWVWLDEYLQGEKLFPNVEFLEAWVYQGDCQCKPFERIPGYYVERLKLGKEGPGIVIKLGCNSCYGKLAQSVGQGVFNSWVWAGLITSGCRAQGLEVLGLHKDPANLLMFATDGIQTLEEIVTPTPLDTGTYDARDKGGELKPLGGWEHKLVPEGVFYARPGIYFPLNPTGDDIDAVRARGIGKGPLLENWQQVINTWYGPPELDPETGKPLPKRVQLATLTRFVGAKTAISFQEETNEKGEPEYKFRRSLDYGEWTPRPTDMTFAPMPKREKILEGGRLQVRRIPLERESRPYSRAIKSFEATSLRAIQTMTEEQPDLSFGRLEK